MAISTADPVKVYIAEDNPILLQGLERALVANGYEVQTAIDGKTLLKLLDGPELPDILLVDVMMPGMSGVDVLNAVRSDSRTQDLPVVLITAAADELLPSASDDGREIEVLLKPFRLNELFMRIDQHLVKQRGAARSLKASVAAAAN